MSASLPRHLRLLVGVFAPLLALSVAHAQIHEEKPGPGLEEGLMLHVAKTEHPVVYPTSPVTLAKPEVADFETGDFSVCFWAPSSEGPGFPHGVLSKGTTEAGWSIGASKSVIASISSPALKSSVTMKAALGADKKSGHHIAAIFKRDARQPLASLWIDGVERVSTVVPPVNVSCASQSVTYNSQNSSSQIYDLRIYNRALTRPEILELTLRGQGTASDKPKPKHPAPPPDGPRFIPQEDETIALIGGTEAVALAESGELEALLLMAFPQTKFHFRCLAWEGDTVFRQDRPMNFGSLEQQLRRVNAGAVFVMFGRQECLDAGQATRSGVFLTADQKPPRSGKNEASGSAAGADGISTAVKNTPLLEEFKTAFGKLLDTVAKVTPNIVVIGPPPFEKAQPPLPDLSKLNGALLRHEEAMKQCTSERALVFASCIPPEDIAQWKTPSLPDGITLNRDACRNIAMVMHLNLQPHAPVGGRGKAVLLPDSIDRLLALPQLPTDSLTAALAAKNRLWHDYWRPSNWAFLHGDRTTQPSSRDPVNPQVRLFPAEQEKYLPLIKEAEEKIQQLVQEAQKKLP